MNGCFFVDCYFIRIFIICRYITILYYLNNVEDGGETAFPVADMKDFNETVSVIDRHRISVALTVVLSGMEFVLAHLKGLETRQELSLLEKNLISRDVDLLCQFFESTRLAQPFTDPFSDLQISKLEFKTYRIAHEIRPVSVSKIAVGSGLEPRQPETSPKAA